MKKYNYLLAAGLLACSPLAQADYIGFGYFTGSGDREVEDSDGFSAEGDIDDVTAMSIRYGFETESDNRVEFSYFISDDEYDFEMSGLDINGLFTFGSSQSIKPYVKLGIGYTMTDEVELSNQDNLYGLALNYGLGALVPVNESIEFQIGYDGKYIAWQDIEVYSGYGSYTRSITDNYGGFFAGINLKF